jgi:hypothetical protein
MLNNLVSPIDHVVINHQNQTRTNGFWGHVRYTREPMIVAFGIMLDLLWLYLYISYVYDVRNPRYYDFSKE